MTGIIDIYIITRRKQNITETFKKLLEEASKDATLIERVNKASKEELHAIAKEINVELDEKDLEISVNQTLSEDELKAVTGGGCGCVFGGGGGDALECGCVWAGMGCIDWSAGYCTDKGSGACECVTYGAGATNGTRSY